MKPHEVRALVEKFPDYGRRLIRMEAGTDEKQRARIAADPDATAIPGLWGKPTIGGYSSKRRGPAVKRPASVSEFIVGEELLPEFKGIGRNIAAPWWTLEGKQRPTNPEFRPVQVVGMLEGTGDIDMENLPLAVNSHPDMVATSQMSLFRGGATSFVDVLKATRGRHPAQLDMFHQQATLPGPAGVHHRPPGKGWTRIPDTKRGGWHRRKGRGWEQWYPDIHHSRGATQEAAEEEPAVVQAPDIFDGTTFITADDLRVGDGVFTREDGFVSVTRIHPTKLPGLLTFNIAGRDEPMQRSVATTMRIKRTPPEGPPGAGWESHGEAGYVRRERGRGGQRLHGGPSEYWFPGGEGRAPFSVPARIGEPTDWPHLIADDLRAAGLPDPGYQDTWLVDRLVGEGATRADAVAFAADGMASSGGYASVVDGQITFRASWTNTPPPRWRGISSEGGVAEANLQHTLAAYARRFPDVEFKEGKASVYLKGTARVTRYDVAARARKKTAPEGPPGAARATTAPRQQVGWPPGLEPGPPGTRPAGNGWVPNPLSRGGFSRQGASRTEYWYPDIGGGSAADAIGPARDKYAAAQNALDALGPQPAALTAIGEKIGHTASSWPPVGTKVTRKVGERTHGGTVTGYRRNSSNGELNAVVRTDGGREVAKHPSHFDRVVPPGLVATVQAATNGAIDWTHYQVGHILNALQNAGKPTTATHVAAVFVAYEADPVHDLGAWGRAVSHTPVAPQPDVVVGPPSMVDALRDALTAAEGSGAAAGDLARQRRELRTAIGTASTRPVSRWPDGTLKPGTVVKDGRKRFVIVESEHLGATPRYNTHALSGGDRGSQMNSVEESRFTIPEDQSLVFTGTNAARRHQKWVDAHDRATQNQREYARWKRTDAKRSDAEVIYGRQVAPVDKQAAGKRRQAARERSEADAAAWAAAGDAVAASGSSRSDYQARRAVYQRLKAGQPAVAPAPKGMSPAKRSKAVAKLEKKAMAWQASADVSRSQDRPTHTRRMRQHAGSAAREADRQESIGNMAAAMAAAIAAGTASDALAGVTTDSLLQRLHALTRRRDVGLTNRSYTLEENLESVKMRDWLDAPKVRMVAEQWAESTSGKQRRGVTAATARRIGDRATIQDQARDGYQFKTSIQERTDLRNMALALKDAGVTSSVWKPTHEALTERRAWDSIGVTSTEDLRALVREVDPMLSKPDPAARIALERKMRISESKIPGFFPTPTRIADRMVTAADVRPGDRVLEPSAGTGRLADAAQAAGATVHVAESSHLLREELTARGHQLVGEDALRISGTYDKILMNPPFENGQDIAHVRHAFEHNLAPGGTLVSVMGEGAFFRERAADREFRDLLDDHGHSEKLPEGTFKEGDHPTGVSTRMVVLHKPG